MDVHWLSGDVCCLGGGGCWMCFVSMAICLLGRYGTVLNELIDREVSSLVGY